MSSCPGLSARSHTSSPASRSSKVEVCSSGSVMIRITPKAKTSYRQHCHSYHAHTIRRTNAQGIYPNVSSWFQGGFHPSGASSSVVRRPALARYPTSDFWSKQDLIPSAQRTSPSTGPGQRLNVTDCCTQFERGHSLAALESWVGALGSAL